jgi:uncharacterized protein
MIRPLVPHRGHSRPSLLRAAAPMLLAAAFVATAAPQAEKPYPEMIRELRQQAEHDYKSSPTSPLASIGRLDLEAGQSGQVRDLAGEAWLEISFDGQKFLVRQVGERTIRMGSGDEEELMNQTTVEPGTVLVSDGVAARPMLEGSLGAVIVFDRNAPPMQTFLARGGLRYFDPDPRFRVEARLVGDTPPSQTTIPTSLGRESSFYRLGPLELSLDGQPLRLYAYAWAPDAKEATIYFRDQTSGNETFGAGRYLDITLDEQGRTVLDFNLAYNPYCAFTDAYNCPLPPRENTLPVPIRAGEQKFPETVSDVAASPESLQTP